MLENADNDIAQDDLLLQIWAVSGYPACDADHQNMFDVGKRAAHVGKSRGGWFDSHARTHNHHDEVRAYTSYVIDVEPYGRERSQ